MSGDVQPRKRKDKKKRKDEGEQVPIQTQAPTPTNTSSDDVNIHVHKEGGTGGGICAKLVFFVLFSALVVVIGMIITQYRGLTDVETVHTESRFSQIFEGWTDSSLDHHDDPNIKDILDDHDIDHDEDDEHNASENDEEEDEDHELSDEDEAEEEEHEPSEEDEEEDEINEGTEVSEERNDEDDDEEQAVEESEENQLDDDDDEDEDEDEDIPGSEEDAERFESEEKDEDEDENEDHDEDEQELENIESEENKYADNDENEVSTENKSEEDTEDKDEDDDDEDEDAENIPIIAKKVEAETIKDDAAPKDETAQESSGMAVKLGVGVALLVVAHLVLVRKWRTASDDKPKPPAEDPNEPVPDLSRRNTIVAPPTFQEVEPDIEPEEEDYSEDDESEEEAHEVKSAKTRYQELRSTYTRSLTPEGEIDYHKPPDTFDDEYEENVDDEEVSEEEDEEDDRQAGEYDEEEEYDDDEDEELLKRLEAKYGKLREGATERQADVENSDSEKSEDDAGYEFSNITNKDDYKIKSDIDEAQKSVQNNSAYAIKLFDKILQKNPSSPRSIYGIALALDYLADQKRSNDILEQALKYYVQLLNTQNVPDALFETTAERCINRMRFVGQYKNAINVHKLVIKKFPNNPKHLNDLAVTYLTINRVEEARSALTQILTKWPNDGFALVHYGFILKTNDGKLEKAIDYLQKGLATRAKGVVDGRFYFHLGDALARLGQSHEAMKIYEEGVQNKVFLSKYQRSLYNVPRLTGKPWWDLSDLPYLDLFRLLKQNWKKIRDEGLAVLNENGYFQNESENLKDTGDWKQFELFARGQKNLNNCRACPFTCSVIERIPEARSCKRGQTKFSVMHPGTHVWPHCGPTNCRLRAHLGLKVPPKTYIRVADEIRSWDEGEIFVFDDSFEHEVWHNGTEFRLVLIVDIWHPELTATEKRGLSPI